jgi:hypothetical protein
VQQALEAVLRLCPSARLAQRLGGSQHYELPVADVTLADVFRYMQAMAAAGGPAEQRSHGIGSGTTAQDVPGAADPAAAGVQQVADGQRHRAGRGSLREAALQVLNWGVSNATLEQVFLGIVAQATATEEEDSTEAVPSG